MKWAKEAVLRLVRVVEEGTIEYNQCPYNKSRSIYSEHRIVHKAQMCQYLLSLDMRHT
jgi:hypothetical protein